MQAPLVNVTTPMTLPLAVTMYICLTDVACTDVHVSSFYSDTATLPAAANVRLVAHLPDGAFDRFRVWYRSFFKRNGGGQRDIRHGMSRYFLHTAGPERFHHLGDYFPTHSVAHEILIDNEQPTGLGNGGDHRLQCRAAPGIVDPRPPRRCPHRPAPQQRRSRLVQMRRW